MSRSLAIWVSTPYQEDRLFQADSVLNRDDCLVFFRLLKQSFNQHPGNVCHTHEWFIQNKTEPSELLFLDIPSSKTMESVKKLGWNSRLFVILQEDEVIMPRNWEINLHNDFYKIFTWHDAYIDQQRYFRWNSSISIDKQSLDWPKVRAGFCTMIAGNKRNTHPLELYSARVEAIRWFESNALQDFDLYGMGWNDYPQGNSVINRIMNRLPFKKLFSEQYRSYKGSVTSKNETLRNYKFAICFENAQNVPGYISEKILDCLYAGCIPIYWGAPNIADYIPGDCFIDRRKFKDYAELYHYLKVMNEKEYEGYLDASRRFFASEAFLQFSSEKVAEDVVRSID